MQKPIKHAVALVIYAVNKSWILIVKRPEGDDVLPGVWGLPAGSLKQGENSEETTHRVAKDKLGVKIAILGVIGKGEIERKNFMSSMIEYECEIIEGRPNVPQSVAGVTQYDEWRWGKAEDLVEAARRESLCSRIYLSSIEKSW